MAKTGVAFAYNIQEIAKIVLIKIHVYILLMHPILNNSMHNFVILIYSEITSGYWVSVLHRVIPRENYCTMHKNKEISEQAHVLFVKLNHTV